MRKSTDSLVLYPHDIAWYSALVSVYGKACLARNSRSITKRHNTAMDADKRTHMALSWRPAGALQYLKREQPFPAYCALLHTTTITLYQAISYG